MSHVRPRVLGLMTHPPIEETAAKLRRILIVTPWSPERKASSWNEFPVRSTLPRMDTGSEGGGPLWAARLATLCGELRQAGGRAAEADAWEETWVLLNAGLQRYLRSHAARLGGLAPDDLEDLAATKSLELINRAVEGVWNPTGRTAAEVAGYLARVARNEVLDLKQHAGRFLAFPDGEPGSGDLDEPRVVGEASFASTAAGLDASGVDRGESPDLAVERGEFTAALVDCVGALAPRNRRVWIFRTLFEMRSRDIAVHPDVGIEPGHVDVVFSRARRTIQGCLDRKGHSLETIPRGVFVDLWWQFRDGGPP
jgi:DNA-directed RNA polymerase specialized sigma24 family protein